MEGTNILSLNKAEMMRALQYYLNEVQFKEPVKISNVREKGNDNIFEITIMDVEEIK